MTDPDLLPCPFCGGEAFIAQLEYGPEGTKHVAECGEVGCGGQRFGAVVDGCLGFDTKQQATAHWNQRIQPKNQEETNRND